MSILKKLKMSPVGKFIYGLLKMDLVQRSRTLWSSFVIIIINCYKIINFYLEKYSLPESNSTKVHDSNSALDINPPLLTVREIFSQSLYTRDAREYNTARYLHQPQTDATRVPPLPPPPALFTTIRTPPPPPHCKDRGGGLMQMGGGGGLHMRKEEMMDW